MADHQQPALAPPSNLGEGNQGDAGTGQRPQSTPANDLALRAALARSRVDAMPAYDRLTIRLIDLLNGGLLPLPSYNDLERNEQRIAIAVCDATPMTPQYWATLDQASREPW